MRGHIEWTCTRPALLIILLHFLLYTYPSRVYDMALKHEVVNENDCGWRAGYIVSSISICFYPVALSERFLLGHFWLVEIRMIADALFIMKSCFASGTLLACLVDKRLVHTQVLTGIVYSLFECVNYIFYPTYWPANPYHACKRLLVFYYITDNSNTVLTCPMRFLPACLECFAINSSLAGR